YISVLVPPLATSAHPWSHLVLVFGIIAGLGILNVIGVRESSAFNEVVAALDIVSETSILFFGFLFAFRPELLIHTMQVAWPSTNHLLEGISLAIVSFVGLESISQAAQETQRPASVMPRTSIALILTILIYALAYSNLALGMVPWHPIPLDAQGHAQQFWHYLGTGDNTGRAIALLSANVPYFGALAYFYVPILGSILVLVSSNSGVYGSSRIAYAMSQNQLLPSLFQHVHRVFRTPAVSIFTFTGLAIVVMIFAAIPSLSQTGSAFYLKHFSGEDGVTFLGDLYAFGAAVSYTFVFIALIWLRLHDPMTPRKFKIPLNIPFMYRGQRVEFPILGIVGFIGIFSILIFTLKTHIIGRVVGPSWLIAGFIFYLIYRYNKKLPVFRSQNHEFEKAQIEILRDAGELESMDEYIAKLKARDERLKAGPAA
ncbi:MAG: APC family permease, partial [Candidatus Baltobacteraceae bacterium]